MVWSCAVCPTIPRVCPASSSPGSPWLPFPPEQWRDDDGWNLPRLGFSPEDRIHSLSKWLRTSKGFQCREMINNLVSGFCTWLQTFKMFYCFCLDCQVLSYVIHFLLIIDCVLCSSEEDRQVADRVWQGRRSRSQKRQLEYLTFFSWIKIFSNLNRVLEIFIVGGGRDCDFA